MIDLYIDEAINSASTMRVITMNGYQMCGKIIGDFADHIIIKSDGKKKMVYKHAISTIEPV